MKSIIPAFPMPIITPRLILRTPQPGDGIMVNQAVLESFDTLHRFMDWAKEKPTIEESEELVQQAVTNWIIKKNDEPWLVLWIIDRKTNQFIGGTGFHHTIWEVPSVETGYWLRDSCSGQGFMTEAINAITQYAFKQLKVNRIAITCCSDNIRSKKVPERLGYELEGRLKFNRRKPDTGQLSDTLIYARYNLDGLPDLAVSW